ncbi:MAG: undecaprenyl-diphosphate phosphatase [Gemmatimonadota bacterium]
MTVWEALLLGFVQGATEFLPVSSSGHLVLGQTLLGIRAPGVAFEIVVHVATLLSVIIVYRGRLSGLALDALRGRRSAWAYIGLLVVATIPAALLGLRFKEPIEALFESPEAVAVAFLVTGVLLWSTRRALARGAGAHPGLGSAVAMGLAQAFALVPGISRSGSTVVAGIWSRVEPHEAAAFSFLMSIPAIAGAAVLMWPEVQASGAVDWKPLAAGGLAAAITGVLAIRTFVAMLKREAFHRFALYLWPLGLLFYLYLKVAG